MKFNECKKLIFLFSFGSAIHWFFFLVSLSPQKKRKRKIVLNSRCIIFFLSQTYFSTCWIYFWAWTGPLKFCSKQGDIALFNITRKYFLLCKLNDSFLFFSFTCSFGSKLTSIYFTNPL